MDKQIIEKIESLRKEYISYCGIAQFSNSRFAEWLIEHEPFLAIIVITNWLNITNWLEQEKNNEYRTTCR